MKTMRVGTLALALSLLVAGLVLGQGTRAVEWWVVSGGGGPSTADGGIALNDTLGQPIIGPSQGDTATLGAGYWTGLGGGYEVYLPLVVRERAG